MLFGLIALSFFVSAVPFGYLFAQRMKGINLQECGSKNIGFTNATREAGVAVGILTLICDFLKGAVPLLIAKWAFAVEFSFCAPSVVSPEFFQLSYVVLASVLGHCYTPFLKGRGGKGVACGFGAMAAYIPCVALAMLLIFLVIAYYSRYVSLASISAAAALTPVSYILVPLLSFTALIALACASTVVIVRHRSNIVRLTQGTEAKFRQEG